MRTHPTVYTGLRTVRRGSRSRPKVYTRLSSGRQSLRTARLVRGKVHKFVFEVMIIIDAICLVWSQWENTWAADCPASSLWGKPNAIPLAHYRWNRQRRYRLVMAPLITPSVDCVNWNRTMILWFLRVSVAMVWRPFKLPANCTSHASMPSAIQTIHVLYRWTIRCIRWSMARAQWHGSTRHSTPHSARTSWKSWRPWSMEAIALCCTSPAICE